MNELMNDPVFRVYTLCTGLLVLKMLILGTTVGITRMVKGEFISPEDYALAGKTAPATGHPTIERLRRAHQNDLENIPAFFVVGALYALTGPSYTVAIWLYGIFTVARYLHTTFYAAGAQPWRTLAFEAANITLVVLTGLVIAAAL